MSITLAQKYMPILDGIYKTNSKTAVFDAKPNEVKWNGAQTVQLYKTTVPGLAAYSRSSGYVSGAITGGWESYQISQDRGRKINIDSMDNEETLGMELGSTIKEILRTREIPEIDAYRFSKIAGTSGIDGATADITIGTTNCVNLIATAEESMGDNEVPEEGRILFVSHKFYNGISSAITRSYTNENGVSRIIESYNGMPVVRVPVGRFCTGIDLMDGTTSGETDGGYEFAASTSKPINFMIVHPSAVISVIKRNADKLIMPEDNQSCDGYSLYYRLYHDIFVDTQKKKGIYAHIASTGLSAKIVG